MLETSSHPPAEMNSRLRDWLIHAEMVHTPLLQSQPLARGFVFASGCVDFLCAATAF